MKTERVHKGKTYTINDVTPSFLSKGDPLKSFINKKIYYEKNKPTILKKEAIRRKNPEVKKKNAETGKIWRANNPNYKAPNDKESKVKYRASEKGKATELAYREVYKPIKLLKDAVRREDSEWVEKDRAWHRHHSKKPEVMARRRELDNIRSKKDSIKKSLRTLLYNSLNRYTNEGKIHKSSKYGVDYNKCIIKLEKDAKLYGYSVKEMREMNYHIDHIIPISLYNLKDKKDVARCFNSLNLRWLSAEENTSKGNRIRPQDLKVIKTLPENIYTKGKSLKQFGSISGSLL